MLNLTYFLRYEREYKEDETHTHGPSLLAKTLIAFDYKIAIYEY